MDAVEKVDIKDPQNKSLEILHIFKEFCDKH